MKHIIVPTDFSKNADNALNYAINIANQFVECTIHLLHVYNVRSETGIMASVNDFMQKKMDEDLAEITQEVKPKLFKGTTLIAKAIEGYPISIILEFAEILDADFVIMGTQGAGGLKSIFMGTNTTEIIKKCSCPVLAIPADYKYKAPKNIVFAADSNIVSTDKILDPLIEIAEKFQAKVNVLHVKEAKELATIDAGVDIYLSDIDHAFHVVENSDTNVGINQFINKTDAHLLCMIHRSHNFLDRLIYESVTKIEAFNCPVPLLVLYDK